MKNRIEKLLSVLLEYEFWEIEQAIKLKKLVIENIAVNDDEKLIIGFFTSTENIVKDYISRESIIEFLMFKGIDETRVNIQLDKLIKKGLIYSPRTNFFKLTKGLS